MGFKIITTCCYKETKIKFYSKFDSTATSKIIFLIVVAKLALLYVLKKKRQLDRKKLLFLYQALYIICLSAFVYLTTILKIKII